MSRVLTAILPVIFSTLALARNITLNNLQLSVNVREQNGSYEIAEKNNVRPVLCSVVGAQVDHRWLKSSQYPKHEISESGFEDMLGHGRQVMVVSTGLTDRPDLVYVLRLYDEHPYGDLEVEVQNRTGKSITVQSIRSVDAIGERPLDLTGADSADRVLSETFSTDTTTQRIYNLGDVPQGLHRAISSQLIYNQESKRSLFIGALSAERFATILRLQTNEYAGQARIASFNVDSTGTTEILLTAQTSNLRLMPEEDRIELSLSVPPGAKIASERLMFATGKDYHSQLESYGAAMRQLLSPPTTTDCRMGWFSAKVYDKDITAGYILSNAQWLSQHLKASGFNCFHIEPGYYYAPGEFSTPNATKFPQGVRSITQDIARLGFKVGGFVTPFDVATDSWIYEKHKEWLVHNATGKPIRKISKRGGDYLLDVTHPGAQEYVRQTYRTLGREWGWHTIDVDGMDNTAFEGYHYQPDTTALEAVRIMLRLIREAAGPDVILITDGSPYMGAAGLVEFAHISQDTDHTFAGTKEAAVGVAGHYYTHRNFWRNHPDAFNVQELPVPLDAVEGKLAPPLTVDEAKASIVLAAVSGGKYDIGDDLPTLGVEPDRLALVTDPTLLQMAKLGRASKPLDLMTYRPEDEQPSIFFLREDERQSMLAVFNWTKQPRSHSFQLSDLGLASGHSYHLYDVLNQDQPMALEGGAIRLDNQSAQSVKLTKIIDESKPAAAPTITVQAPTNAKVRQDLLFSAKAAEDGVPALAYHWDFGDGITADGASLGHTFTLAGTYRVKLVADGLDGIPAEKTFSVVVDGLQEIGPARRYIEPSR